MCTKYISNFLTSAKKLPNNFSFTNDHICQTLHNRIFFFVLSFKPIIILKTFSQISLRNHLLFNPSNMQFVLQTNPHHKVAFKVRLISYAQKISNTVLGIGPIPKNRRGGGLSFLNTPSSSIFALFHCIDWFGIFDRTITCFWNSHLWGKIIWVINNKKK